MPRPPRRPSPAPPCPAHRLPGAPRAAPKAWIFPRSPRAALPTRRPRTILQPSRHRSPKLRPSPLHRPRRPRPPNRSLRRAAPPSRLPPPRLPPRRTRIDPRGAMPLRTALALALALSAAFPARAATLQQWQRQMEARKVQVSAGLWDLDSGKVLESCHPDEALVPASTTKVVTTYALLKTWKPDYELKTEIWGDLHGSTVAGDLVFKGFGDPFLT